MARGEKNSGNSSMLLKLDSSIKRENERSAREEPVVPLTTEEKDKLTKECREKCRNAYVIRMTQSALMEENETIQDLENDSFLLMKNILDKFDKSKCGPIAEFDVPGKTNPKTLKFYFLNYFFGRVNFTACEARDWKKKRGTGPNKGAVSEIVYDEEYQGQFSEYDYEYEATGTIFQKLKDRSPEFKRFFHQSFIVELKEKELREEWGERYNKLKAELTKFRADLKKKHHSSYLKEIGK